MLDEQAAERGCEQNVPCAVLMTLHFEITQKTVKLIAAGDSLDFRLRILNDGTSQATQISPSFIHL